MKINNYIFSFLISVLSLFTYCDNFAQGTLMPLPPHNNVYYGSGQNRGYWFTAPTNFTITGLRVPIEAGTGTQNIMVILINDNPPVVWGTQSTNFTVLYHGNNLPSNVIQNVNIPVTTGQHIGILGNATSGQHSYATNGPVPSTINGLPVTLTRFLSQAYGPTGITQYSTEPPYQIARVEMYYNACTSYDTVAVSICDNQSYAINNKIYTAPGNYIDTFKIGACDSIVYTQLTVNPTYTTTLVDSVYEGIPYNFNGVDYFYSGRYNTVFSTVNGCDSTVRLDLTVIPVKRIFVDTTICDHNKVSYYQKEYNKQNLYIDTFIFEDHHEILMLNLKVKQKPNITVEIEGRNWDDLCIGEPLNFKAKGGERYEWFKVQSPLNVMYHTGETLKGWAYDSVTYLMVKGYDELGCYNEYFYDLKAKNCCQYFIPTAFTPNGDGLNDEFVVKGFQPQEFKLQIFNRLGQLVFQSEKLDAGWNGISANGNEYPTDVYFYHINGKCFDGTVIDEKGDITLIR